MDMSNKKSDNNNEENFKVSVYNIHRNNQIYNFYYNIINYLFKAK